MKIKKTIRRMVIGILLCGMLSGMMVTVYANDGNTLPFVPFTPNTPSEPETPDVPDTPSEPETPDEPDTPTEPEMPDVPDTPSEPETPDVPDTPSEPETPDVPDTPSEPETPDEPDTPTEPEMPEMPSEPNLPGNSPDWSDIFDWLDKAEESEKQDNTDKKDNPKEEPEQITYQTCKRDESCPMYTFTDLDKTAWYHDDIHYCIDNGLMNGTGAHTFAPDSTLTRAMLVTVLWRLEGEPVVNYLMKFSDVESEQWYTEAVRWAAAEGIVNGYGDDTFGPMNDVTREQVMAILHRYAAYKGLESGMIFPIIPQYDYSLWAENDILWADMVGLTDGLGVDIFDMTVSADRAEIAAYLRRFCEAFEAFMEE